MAISRRKGPEVLLSCRVAPDVIESMSGRQYVPMDMTRAGRWLEEHGILPVPRRDGGGAVFAWSAIDGGATLLAATVAGFWSGWVAGTLPPH